MPRAGEGHLVHDADDSMATFDLASDARQLHTDLSNVVHFDG
jgi:hypothetical protein